MLTSGTRPPSGVKLSCMALTAPQRGVGGDGREQRRVGDAEADLLAFHVAAGLHRARRLVDAERASSRIAARLGPVGDGHADQEQDAPSPPTPPSPGAGRRPCGRRRRSGRAESRRSATICTKLVSGVGFSNGCARVGVEEAAAVGARAS